MRWAIWLVVACACSGKPAAPDAYDMARCIIRGNYGDLGMVRGTAGTIGGASTITIVLDAGPPKNDFFVKLIPGKGAFSAGAIRTGTYAIASADANYATCGLCVNLVAGITMTGPSKFFFADAGSVTITTPASGTAHDLHFAEIDIGSGAEIPGGCVGAITTLMFAGM
jgi:hypothetical protein